MKILLISAVVIVATLVKLVFFTNPQGCCNCDEDTHDEFGR